MSNCYLCDQPFNGQDVVDHGEHVIQNAIGGLLIAHGILCKACGQKLGSSVDDGLGKTLRALCVVFDIRRDRDKRLVVPAEVTLKEGLLQHPPTRDFFVEPGTAPRPNGPVVIREDAAMVAQILGSTDEQAKTFAKSATITKLEACGYNLKFGSDTVQLIDGVILRVDCDSLALARGLIKIAIGYACDQGIGRCFLEHLIVDDSDIICDDVQVNQAVLPYYPTGWGEGMYEAERYQTDDFPPNHQLSLFSYGKRLFCYIDLFGVIQRYVLLSNAWTGPEVRARYVQRCPKWVYDENDGRARRIKDLHLLAQEFGIEMTGRPWDDVAREVRQAATSRPYALPPSDHLAKPGHMLTYLVMSSKMPPPEHEVISTLRRRATIADQHFGCDVNATIANDRLRLLQFIQNWKPNDFRITNEKGFSPDLSAGVSASRLAEYRDFRLGQFSEAYASPWSLEAR
jgi:hypothetical protein